MSTPAGDWAWRYLFNGNRVQNKRSAARTALKLVIAFLSSGILPPETIP